MTLPLKKTFWYVWCPIGAQPRFKHENWFSAENEARRLARENHGHTFVVLESKAAYTVEVDPVTRTDFAVDADVPF